MYTDEGVEQGAVQFEGTARATRRHVQQIQTFDTDFWVKITITTYYSNTKHNHS